MRSPGGCAVAVRFVSTCAGTPQDVISALHSQQPFKEIKILSARELLMFSGQLKRCQWEPPNYGTCLTFKVNKVYGEEDSVDAGE